MHALSALSELTTNELKQVINRKGTGRKHAGLPKRSSAPYQPPVNQTGALMNSWTTRIQVVRISKFYKALRIGSILDYAAFLEFGVENKYNKARIKGGQVPAGWRVKPRPYIEETIAITEKKHMTRVIEGFGKLLKQGMMTIRPAIRRVSA